MDKFPFPYERTHPHLKRKFERSILVYQAELLNPIIQSFLRNKTNYDLFVKSICFPTNENHIKLDRAFQQFYGEIRLIHYISKHLTHYSWHFYQKEKKEYEYHLYTFDQPIKEESNMYSLGSLISDGNNEVIDSILIQSKSLMDHVQDPKLYRALQRLTIKQRKALELYYLYNLTHTEIGKILQVSQQAVSKMINNALRKLRIYYMGGNR
ncbi:sigma-70 family RNA polymerase sigma factor [Neobacillus mesonae]|uniref:sigma-70 family RNA polymerase sigma factor n=1 Tax=Neobacillus mesonae TaxID=1193713 RepID=UPI002E1AA7DA|nr:sigma-70 family RNA polymerase sigma factor [Neobacillus mesonae]